MNNYERAVAINDEVIQNRRIIHQNAEVGFDLPKTSKFVMEKLTEYGYEPKRMAENGVVATVGKGGKTILLRADMDALPMHEESGLDFASKEKACHSCGHDIHTAMLLGAAKLLKENEADLKGTVKLMFQPAEELLTGAISMVEAGVLENPKVDVAMMLHVHGLFKKGIVLRSGDKCASSNNFRIIVKGAGTHGALPHNGVDPVYIAAQIIIGATELVSREIPFLNGAVLTMGHIEGGSAVNIIPGEVLIEGTMRTVSPDTQKHLKTRLPELVADIAKAYRGSAELEYLSDVPVLVNEVNFAKAIGKYITELGEGKFDVYEGACLPGSEDFAFVTSKVPGVMLNLGMPFPDENGKTYPLHNSKVKFDESSMPIGVATFVECATRWLEDNN